MIGVIVDKNVESYKVHIGTSGPALLSTLAFDGASRRNKPNLQVGSLIYARVVVANKSMDPELSCMTPAGARAKDWVTGQGLFGEITKGYVFECNLSLARA